MRWPFGVNFLNRHLIKDCSNMCTEYTQNGKYITCRIQVEIIFIKLASCFPCVIIKLPLLLGLVGC